MIEMLGIVCVGALASGISTSVFQRRHLTSSALAHFLVSLLGATAVVGGIGHIIGITVAAATGDRGFTYDFRTYSLWLLGAILISAGAALIRTAHGFGDGGHEAFGRASGIAAVLAVVTAPLIPILAPPASVLSLMSVALVAFLRARSGPWQV